MVSPGLVDILDERDDFSFFGGENFDVSFTLKVNTLGPFPDTRGDTLLGVGFSLLAGEGIQVSLGLNVRKGIPYRAIASVGLAAHHPLFFT